MPLASERARMVVNAQAKASCRLKAAQEPRQSAAPTNGRGAARAAAAASDMLVFDMRPDDGVEIRLRLEAERFRPLGVELARPAGDDAADRLNRFAPDQRHGLVAGDAA